MEHFIKERKMQQKSYDFRNIGKKRSNQYVKKALKFHTNSMFYKNLCKPVENRSLPKNTQNVPYIQLFEKSARSVQIAGPKNHPYHVMGETSKKRNSTLKNRYQI